MTTRNATRAFRAGVAPKLGWYVYRLVDPRTETTFYVGKGKDNRVFAHFTEAENGVSGNKTERIREIWESGKDVAVIIHRHDLEDEKQAFLVESVLIDLLPNLVEDPEIRTNIARGHGSAELGAKPVDVLNHQYAAEAAKIRQPIALIKVNRKWLSHYKSTARPPSTAEIYQMVRGHWVVSPGRHKSVRYAAAVAFGLIREVFEITSWSDKDSNGRVCFEGKVAPEMHVLNGTHVNDIFPQGAQAPVRWFYPESAQVTTIPKQDGSTINA